MEESVKKKEKRPIFSRDFVCPLCKGVTKFPNMWLFGIEVVFRCSKCDKAIKTGYKMGALLFGLSLTLAMTTANVGAYVCTSITIPFWTILILPLTFIYGFLIRRRYLMHKYRKLRRRSEKI